MMTRNLKILFLLLFACVGISSHANNPTEEKRQTPVKKILFIGDSMTGWLSERLNAYGNENGFEVSTVVWDGSTIQKWGNSAKLASLIKEQNPDAVFVSLGMNELFEAHPAARFSSSLAAIKHAVGDRPMLWVGPPSWPGHDKGKILNDWLEKELGSDSFFRSSNLNLPRQSAKNPHPTKQGMIQWMDQVVEWIPEHSNITLPGVQKPTSAQMLRGKYFVYKRIKENL